jgi:hypothetical protein
MRFHIHHILLIFKVCGTDQGLYARARKNSSCIKLRSVNESGVVNSTELPLDSRALLTLAKEGGFFSYAGSLKVITYSSHKSLNVN